MTEAEWTPPRLVPVIENGMAIIKATPENGLVSDYMACGYIARITPYTPKHRALSKRKTNTPTDDGI